MLLYLCYYGAEVVQRRRSVSEKDMTLMRCFHDAVKEACAFIAFSQKERCRVTLRSLSGFDEVHFAR